MAQMSMAVARRTGQVMPHSGTRLSNETMDSRIYEYDYVIPDSMRTNLARNPIMFGSMGSAGAGWFGNEPEAKAGGGRNFHAKNLFGFGQVDEEVLQYLGAEGEDTFDKGDFGLGAGTMAIGVLGVLAYLKIKGRI